VFSPIKGCIVTCSAVFEAIVFHFYPTRTDPPEIIHFQPTPEAQKFYDAAFDTKQALYATRMREAARIYRLREHVEEFVATFHLKQAHGLDVGAGDGLLQDVIDDYTGLDISATARAAYHKPFVQADARAMPFRDGEFDVLWTLKMLEHVPNPKQVLREMRRVLKPNGLLYFYPAWLVSDLAAEGYVARPWRDFGLTGKMVKATVPIQNSPLFIMSYMLPIRLQRLGTWKIMGGPTMLHYRPLNPNYDVYWTGDSDAVNSIDLFEAYLWFVSRGDQCLNCPPGLKLLTRISHGGASKRPLLLA
jgi:SAM-dependent methyltransferase